MLYFLSDFQQKCVYLPSNNQFVHGMAQNIYQYRIGTSRHG